MSVSCVMLTHNRRHLIPVALKSWLSQTWADRELIVIDDGDDHVDDLFADIGDCTYMHVGEKQIVSEKLNRACEIALGEVICTWDDDDWSDPRRIEQQIGLLRDSRKAFAGYSNMLFWDGKTAARYIGAGNYAVGTSQTYLKEFWSRNRCKPKNISYDNDLWEAARREGKVVAIPGNGMMVARIHAQNISGDRKASIGTTGWPIVPSSEIPQAFFEAMHCSS